MSSSWSPTVKVKLGASRYPHRLRWLVGLGVLPVVWLVTWPWWAKAVLVIGVLLSLRGWRLAQMNELQLKDNVLTVSGQNVQRLEQPGRVMRLGPWLALQTPKGWLHLFADQAPRERLQPIYQWLWVNRVK